MALMVRPTKKAQVYLQVILARKNVTTPFHIQTILSVLESHQFMPVGSQTILPVGNCTPPQRLSYSATLNYNTLNIPVKKKRRAEARRHN